MLRVFRHDDFPAPTSALELGQEVERLRAVLGNAVRACAYLDDTSPRASPGPLSGPARVKVAHVLGIDLPSAFEFCRSCGVDPDFDCAACNPQRSEDSREV